MKEESKMKVTRLELINRVRAFKGFSEPLTNRLTASDELKITLVKSVDGRDLTGFECVSSDGATFIVPLTNVSQFFFTSDVSTDSLGCESQRATDERPALIVKETVDRSKVKAKKAVGK